jgi:cytochrome c551/c552
MSKKKRLFWYTILGLIIVIQVYPVTAPEVVVDNPGDIMKSTEIPANVSSMLKSACYDCHSNETVYPWYTNVAPVKWLVYRDTREGRKELNFSNWASMDKMDQAEALDEISTEVMSGDMPMKIYPIMHADAKLSDEDRQAIADWADEYTEALFE